VGDRRAHHRDLDQVLLRVLDALPDRLRDLAGLAQPDTDVVAPSPTTTTALKLNRRPP
jgi:hypothetical protein